jgi:hypothetical protein
MLETTGPGELPGQAESPSRTAGNGPVGSVGPRERLDWLDDAQLCHGGLRLIETAIARGWLKGVEHSDRRLRLVDALARLALDLASPIRESLQACRLLAVSMTVANLRMLDRSLPRRRKARRRRMGTDLRGEGGNRYAATGRAGPTVKNRETGPGSDRTETTGPDRPADRPQPAALLTGRSEEGTP